MIDKKYIRDTFDLNTIPKFVCVDAYGKSMYILTNFYKVNRNVFAFDITDSTFAEFCKLNYSRRHIKRASKAEKEKFQISDVPEIGHYISGCRVISVQKNLNLAYISWSELRRPNR